jgi:hypothetical protein
MSAHGAGVGEGGLTWTYEDDCVRSGQEMLTVLAHSLVATRQAEGVHGELVADGASQLEGDFILGECANRMSDGIWRT